MDLPLKQALDARLASPAPYPVDRFEGRGIVTCAGGQRYFTCAWVLVWVLRRVVRCGLPIQVWHAGRGEMSEGMQRLLEEEGVEVVDAETVAGYRPGLVSAGWPLKPYAIAQSRFREVLFLDADTVPLIDPAIAFEWDLFARDGLLLWPDVLDIRRDTPVWSRLGLDAEECPGLESSVLAIDKARCWELLDVAVLLNEHWDETYDLIYGDKDSYLLAARLLGRRFGLIPSRPFVVDDDLVQRDVNGEPFVHHRTASKWNLFGVNQPVVQPDIDAACALALADLRRRWSGVVFNAPPRSAAAVALERELAATRRFRYTAAGKTRTLELLSAGRVGEGRGDFEQHWAVVDRDDRLVLQLFSTLRLAVELTHGGDGVWRGGAVCDARFDAALAAERDAETWPASDGRSSAPHLQAILDPSLLATGRDAVVAHEIAEALALLNRVFDDVPEELARWMEACDLTGQWREPLEAMRPVLSEARDARMMRRGRRHEGQVLSADQYRRVY